MVHTLSEDDPDGRMKFCERALSLKEETSYFRTTVLFSDKADYYVPCGVNQQNTRC
jgi:hypothetical protein